MTVRPIDVAPTIAYRKRVLTHVVISVKINVAHVIARVTHEYITAIVTDIKIIRIRRVIMVMNAIHIAPVCVAISVINRVRAVIGNPCHRCCRPDMRRARRIAAAHVTATECKKCNSHRSQY